MRYLTSEDIMELYARIFVNLGGKIGLRDRALLESALNQPKASFGGHDLYEGVIAKAVVLCEAIIRNHPFTDGNKRVGILAMLRFLEINGYDTSRIPDDILYNIAVEFAEGSLRRENAVRILSHFLPEVIENYIYSRRYITEVMA